MNIPDYPRKKWTEVEFELEGRTFRQPSPTAQVTVQDFYRNKLYTSDRELRDRVLSMYDADEEVNRKAVVEWFKSFGVKFSGEVEGNTFCTQVHTPDGETYNGEDLAS